MVDLSPLIIGIYDAALRPELWNSALEGISDALGGAGLNITVIDTANHGRCFLGSAGLDPELNPRFLNNPAYVEPSMKKWLAGLTAPPVGKLFYREQIWTDREYRTAPLYDDVIRPQKLWHWAFAPLVFDRDVFIPIGLLRAASAPALYDRNSAETISGLLPHLVRGLETSLRLEILREEAATMEGLIERLPIGVVLVDEAGSVLQLNPTADAIRSASDGLTVVRGRLAAASAGEAAKLRRLIDEAGRTSRGIGASAGGAMPLSRPSGKRPLAILVAPLRSEDGPLETPQARAIVFVSDPERNTAVPTELLARLYRLTPRQTALMQRLAEGDTLNAAADALNISRNTARTHLHLIFEKTGARRQTELVRLLHMFPIDISPF